MLLREIECPNCGAPVTSQDEEEQIQCHFCGTLLNLQRSLCPACQFVNPEGTRFCTQCGESILRICPACEHENWAGVEHCANCGRVLDMLEIMTKSRVRDTRARMAQQRQEALAAKIRETAQAEARMEQYWQMEQDRQVEAAKRAARHRQRERKVIVGFLIGAAACILLLIVLLFLVSPVGPA